MSFIIKRTFITAINKALSMYGSFSYFSGKTAEKEIKLLDVSKFFRILYKKKHLKKA